MITSLLKHTKLIVVLLISVSQLPVQRLIYS